MHSYTDRIIAANVADLANTQQVPLRVLAERSGIGFDRLRAYLASDRGTLTLSETQALADALGTTTSTLTVHAPHVGSVA